MNEKMKVVDYYSQIVTVYNNLRLGNFKTKMISNLQADWFISNIGGQSHTCLEVGCGTGRMTHVLLGKVRTLIATDASLTMIKSNRRTATKSCGKIEYVLCDASFLPFRSDCFDLVVGARIFWHIPNYVRTFGEALRVVKVNGTLLFDFPSLAGPFSFFSALHSVKHEVLTLFVHRRTIEEMFKDSAPCVRGNTSLLFSLMPTRLLSKKAVRRLIYILEGFDRWFLKDYLFSYYLVRIEKRIQSEKAA